MVYFDLFTVKSALRAGGFHTIRTMEARLKTYDVQRQTYTVPDFGTSGGEGGELSGGAAKRRRADDGAASSSAAASSPPTAAPNPVPPAEVMPGQDDDWLMAKANPMMRGHTAYLTFATRSTRPYPTA